MVVEVPTSSRDPEKTDVDDVAVSTQFDFDRHEQPTYSSANSRDKKKAFCFFMLIVLILALTASTIYFGFRSHKLKERYESLNVRSSGSKYRLNLYKPILELDLISDSQWQNTADAIAQNCLEEQETDVDIEEKDGEIFGDINEGVAQINWKCLEQQIKALKKRRSH